MTTLLTGVAIMLLMGFVVETAPEEPRNPFACVVLFIAIMLLGGVLFWLGVADLVDSAT